MDHDDHAPDGGFALDLPRMLPRRRVLTLLGAGGAAMLGSAADAQGLCGIPASETAGPFPADGTNAKGGQVVNVLTESGVLRQDIRPSFAGRTGDAEGVPLQLTVTIVAADGCTPMAGAALYLWHCDAPGRYSLYDLPDRNYLRGLGVADASGRVGFTTIVPGCYPGRWPHLHFEVFADAASAVSGDATRLTSQFALPEAPLPGVYELPAYGDSLQSLARVSLERDGIFRDNSAEEMAAMMLDLAGDAAGGYAAEVTVALG